jgi:tRNA(fMet)-specific endonuclease VapC
MVMYILDTNICIYLMKHQPPAVAKKFESLAVGDVAISSITLAELEHGVEQDPELKAVRGNALSRLLELLLVLDFDKHAAKSYGKLRSGKINLGRHRFDVLIAAHAIATDAILVTNNLKDFIGIRGLIVENWVTGEEAGREG